MVLDHVDVVIKSHNLQTLHNDLLLSQIPQMLYNGSSGS